MSGEVSRYYLLGSGRFADAGPVRPALLLGISVVLIIVSRSPIVIAVSAIFALIGLSTTVQRPRQEARVLCAVARELSVAQPAHRGEIPYGNIASAENPGVTQGSIGQWIGNAAVAWNHLFGGDFPRVGAKGETNTSVLVIRLKKYAWSFMPPFMIPKKSLRLIVDGAESLRAELLERLPLVRPTSETS